MVTVDTLEALAQQYEASSAAEAERLQRLIRAYARIVAAREPAAFGRRRPTRLVDEAGHYDSSYPPKAEWADRTGPRLITVRDSEESEEAITSGYYYTYRVHTDDPGVYIGRAGGIYGCEMSGTAALGHYAAHPGDCERDIDLDWRVRREVPLDDLRAAEAHMRTLAFPLVAAATAG